jgi:hypothetical protein
VRGADTDWREKFAGASFWMKWQTEGEAVVSSAVGARCDTGTLVTPYLAGRAQRYFVLVRISVVFDSHVNFIASVYQTAPACRFHHSYSALVSEL